MYHCDRPEFLAQIVVGLGETLAALNECTGTAYENAAVSVSRLIKEMSIEAVRAMPARDGDTTIRPLRSASEALAAEKARCECQ